MTIIERLPTAALLLSVLALSACNDSGGSSSSGGTGGSGGIGTSEDNGKDWGLLDPPQLVLDQLNDVFFVDDQTGWAVGNTVPVSVLPAEYQTLLLKTTDGGESWVEQGDGDFDRTLRTVHFVDENTGWAAGGLSSGQPPLLLHTNDGGDTWEEQSHPITAAGTIFDIQFIDANLGWAVGGELLPGNYRFVLSTEDGGDTWNEIYSASNIEPFQSVSFVDAQYGWAVGNDSESDGEDSYWYTTDGGQNWQSGRTGIGDETGLFSSRFQRVQFVDRNNGWLMGVLTVMGTTDGGANWSVVRQETGSNMYDLHRVDADTAWLVGSGIGGQSDEARLFFTDDGGANWVRETVIDLPTGLDDNTQLLGVHAINASQAWAVGRRLTLLRREP